MSGTFDEIRAVSQLLTNANIILEDEIEARYRARIFQIEPTEENAELVRDEFQEMRDLIVEPRKPETIQRQPLLRLSTLIKWRHMLRRSIFLFENRQKLNNIYQA